MKTIYAITSDTLGHGNAELGAKLMPAFLRTLTTLEEKPEALVFYNAAVNLLSAKSPVLEQLKALDGQGVELLACVTCLEFYALVDKLAVGRVSNMREIVAQLEQAEKVITV